MPCTEQVYRFESPFYMGVQLYHLQKLLYQMYIVETGSTKRNIEVLVTAIDTTDTTSTKYTVSLIANGNDNIRDNKNCTLRIDAPVGLSPYTVISDYWLTPAPFATVISSLQYDDVVQADVDDAYGIDINFQEMSVSPDWDFLALSSSTGIGGGGDTSYQINIDINAGTVTDNSLPSGWSTSSTGVGDLTITHSLNSAAMPGFGLSVLYNGGVRIINPSSIGLNSITFKIEDDTGVASDGNVVGRLTF